MTIEAEELTAVERATCADLVADLPDELAGEPAREVAGHAELGRAWGEPALVVTCGAPEPARFDRFSDCLEVNGVGWYAPPAQEKDLELDVLLTAAGHRPRVSLLVPAERRGSDVATALTALADPVEEHLELVDACA